MSHRIRWIGLSLVLAFTIGCGEGTHSTSREIVVPPEAGGMSKAKMEQDLADQAKMSKELTEIKDDTIIVH